MFAGIKRFCREIDQSNSIFVENLELPRFDTHSNILIIIGIKRKKGLTFGVTCIILSL